MMVVGFGFRHAASIASLRSALAAAGGSCGLHAVAALAHKAKAPALRALAEEMGLPIQALTAQSLAGIDTFTQSERIVARFGTGSVAEALALVAAGPNARLLAPRACSADGMAVAAIACSPATEGEKR
ncbi:cobalamin biosynthesis protein [Acetobacter vaccinii]|uniref:Cobalamin biosynthesis protein n=1 Tax=Acetobacter vaccinii TaxID=2592655 RepID=A0A5C1YQS9_9PROT|nr:cobalamin biosynthesis protein [Acetobacter vaccinii]